jgi:hypothetical protein
MSEQRFRLLGKPSVEPNYKVKKPYSPPRVTCITPTPEIREWFASQLQSVSMNGPKEEIRMSCNHEAKAIGTAGSDRNASGKGKEVYIAPDFACEKLFETSALVCGKAVTQANCHGNRKLS